MAVLPHTYPVLPESGWQEQVSEPAFATMSVAPCEAGNFPKQADSAFSSSRTGDCSSVWELVLVSSTLRLHCVPMDIVVMVACVLWLQDTPRLHAATSDSAMIQHSGIDGVPRPVLVSAVVFSEIGIPL